MAQPISDSTLESAADDSFGDMYTAPVLTLPPSGPPPRIVAHELLRESAGPQGSYAVFTSSSVAASFGPSHTAPAVPPPAASESPVHATSTSSVSRLASTSSASCNVPTSFRSVSRVVSSTSSTSSSHRVPSAIPVPSLDPDVLDLGQVDTGLAALEIGPADSDQPAVRPRKKAAGSKPTRAEGEPRRSDRRKGAKTT